MKYQVLFSDKNKKNINMPSAELAERVIKVKHNNLPLFFQLYLFSDTSNMWVAIMKRYPTTKILISMRMRAVYQTDNEHKHKNAHYDPSHQDFQRMQNSLFWSAGLIRLILHVFDSKKSNGMSIG